MRRSTNYIIQSLESSRTEPGLAKLLTEAGYHREAGDLWVKDDEFDERIVLLEKYLKSLADAAKQALGDDVPDWGGSYSNHLIMRFNEMKQGGGRCAHD